MHKHPLETTVAPDAGVVKVMPTQLRRPRRATIRTVFEAFVALCAMAPVLVATTGLQPDQLPWLAGVLGVAAVVTRIMALPQVEDFLRRYVKWLAAAPSAPDPRGEGGGISRHALVGAAVVLVVAGGIFVLVFRG